MCGRGGRGLTIRVCLPQFWRTTRPRDFSGLGPAHVERPEDPENPGYSSRTMSESQEEQCCKSRGLKNANQLEDHKAESMSSSGKCKPSQGFTDQLGKAHLYLKSEHKTHP